jgi:O-antigen ligase
MLARTGDPRGAGPHAPPLGYAYADAALAVQAAAMACLAAVLSRPLVARALLLTAAAGFAAYAVLIGSAAGAATGALVLAAGAWAMLRAPAGTRVLRWAAAVTALAAVAVTLVLGATRDTDGSGAEALTERRVALWHDAVDITVGHPLTGVGPGRFPAVSPTAMADADTQAAHSAVLEQAAETGLPGAVLLVVLGLWALVRIGPGDGGSRGRDAGAAAMVAVAAWSALALHTAVDYVADSPAVLAAAGLVMGLGTRRPARVPAPRPELAAGTRG